MSRTLQWTAIILAGDRGKTDSVASAANTDCKAMAQVAGQPLLERVLQALDESNLITHSVVVGPTATERTKPWLNALKTRYACQILEPESGPSASALHAIACAQHYPLLLLTCDLPMLNAAMVDRFCKQAQVKDADIVAAYVSRAGIREQLPNMKKTVYQSAGREVCFANLFAILNPAGVEAIRFWRSIEAQRKSPLAIIKRLGVKNLLRYKLGMLDLERETGTLSNTLGCQAALMESTDVEIAIDVDSADDYHCIQKFLCT